MPSVFSSEQKVEFDSPESLKRLGLIALATDLTSERDFARMFPLDQVGIFATRVAYQNPTTPENLRKMGPRLSAAAELILPGESLNAICYSCTAASFVIGDREVEESIHAARPGIPVVTPTKSARLAFSALGVQRIAVLTPYLPETSEPLFEFFSRYGFEITRMECFGLEDDREMARVSISSIVDAACRIDSPETEALFVSCTALPAVWAVEEIEQRIGKPVVSSNQASAWVMMHHAGISSLDGNYGKLFEMGIPENWRD
ncbi:MAG: ectoine utilization protein EutA [SAR324 cluster bacterium]|nr:ectoine utilization protein EutA [SAR324 cluster bacterium]